MCGLFGVVSPTVLTENQKSFVNQSVFVGTLRGYHSTGLSMIDKDNNIRTFKKALSGPDFLTCNVGSLAKKELNRSFVVLGHNRAATRGGTPTDITAHPFEFGSIVGAHNGTIDYTCKLPVTAHEVDSMNLLDSISRTKTHEQVVSLLEKTTGSYALTWYDTETELMWLVHNDQRPLSVAHAGESFYWTSEREQLAWMLVRNKCISKKDLNVIEDLPTNTLLGYDTRNMKVIHSLAIVPEKKITPCATKSWKYPYEDKHTTNGDSIAYSFSNEFKDMVAYVPLEKAIRKKMWAKTDEDVMVRFLSSTPLGPLGTTIKLTGHAYTYDGEKFVCRAYGTNRSDRELDKMYIARVNGVYVSQDKSKIHMLSLTENSISVMSETKEEVDKTIADLESNGKGKSKGKPKEQEKKESTVSSIKQRVKNYFFKGPGVNEWISKDSFLKKVAAGCSFCGEPIEPMDHENLGWLNEDSPLCPECLELITESSRG